jgi:predicted O-linked N-acetylglucosamine transferase (SPINDLY family)
MSASGSGVDSPADSATVAAEEGQALLEQGDARGARLSFAKAAALQPTVARWHGRVAAANTALGELDTALKSIARAIELDPANWKWIEQRASVLYKAGDIGAVIEIYENRVKRCPHEFGGWRTLARLLTEAWQFARADAVITNALVAFGPEPALLALQVFVKQELGHSQQALDVATSAAARFPDRLQFQFDSRLLLPMVYANTADLQARRKRYEEGLDELESMLPVMQRDPARIFSLERTNFLLAYQGEDDLPLQRRYANILGSMIVAADPALCELPRRTASSSGGRGRLRIGFVGKWFFSCTAGNYFERWITRLDAARFERFVYYTGQVNDEVTARIGAASEHFVRLQADVRGNAMRIRADELDMLIHPEVGMSTGSYLLSSLRLAPIQCAAWGHPVTTGNAAIDAYFSCAEMEPSGFETHYSERVLLLDGIGVDFAMPDMDKTASRADFGLPATGRLYFCPQSLFKIHPDMDEALAKILEGDSSAVLVFFQADSRAVTMAFGDRLTKTLAARGISAKGQLKFLPRLPGDAFRKALALADVLLDPFHWSGGGTSLDAFAGDLPVVTLPGRFMRGRQTAAMLRMMGAEALVAADVDRYVQTAIEVATNQTLNRDLRATISTNKRVLFDRDDLSRQFADKLSALASEFRQA